MGVGGFPREASLRCKRSFAGEGKAANAGVAMKNGFRRSARIDTTSSKRKSRGQAVGFCVRFNWRSLTQRQSGGAAQLL